MRILLATIGSLGDLHPCLALSTELKRRGYSVAIASTEAYRSRVLQLGVDFYSLRPDWNPSDSTLIGQCEDLKSGPEVLFRKLLLPHLEDTYRDLVVAAKGCDLLLAGELVFAAPLVAEKLALRWGSLILSPCSFLSAHDPSLLVNMPQLIWLRGAGWLLNRAALQLGEHLTRRWWEPVRRLRRKEGLRSTCAPVTRDKFSPTLVLALFSEIFAERQPDWPAHTVQTGFPFHEEAVSPVQSPQLASFLCSGSAPMVFTLGSTAVSHPGNFYQASRDAALRLGRRAVLIGTDEPQTPSDEVLAIRYAPYAEVFPHASVIVHQGGSGTTGQALRAGHPQLFVPFGWDEPDNALRAKRLGAGLTITRKRYSADTAYAMLKRLLCEPHFASRAAELGRNVRSQHGIQEACDAIEAALAQS